MSFLFESDHREYLRKEFRQICERRPLYSQRAFARDLGLSPSSLGDYLKERIRLSPGRISQVAKKLRLTPEQRQHWVDLVDERFAKKLETKKLAQLRVKARLQAQSQSLSLDQFKLIAEWFHLAYLELVDMDSKKYSNKKVAAAALGLPVKTVSIAVKRLEALGFLKKDDQGHFAVDPTTRLGDQLPSEAIRQYHGELMAKAQKALETHDMKRRFNSSTVVALQREDVDKILDELKCLALKFLDPYLVANAKKKDSLYCLSLQFFDLLQEKGK